MAAVPHVASNVAVVLGAVENTSIIFNGLTGEAVSTQGKVAVRFDSAGWGYLVSDTGEKTWLKSIFQKVLASDPDGKRFIKDRASKSTSWVQELSLADDWKYVRVAGPSFLGDGGARIKCYKLKFPQGRLVHFLATPRLPGHKLSPAMQ